MHSNVLVTGAARSGTTLIGKVLSAAPRTNYVLEPFNRHVWMHVPDYYTYVGQDSPKPKKEQYNQFIEDVIALRNLHPCPANGALPLWQQFLSRIGIRRINLTTSYAVIKQRLGVVETTIFKDPSACFLARKLVNDSNFQVIYTVRHPAAIYLSRKKLGWSFNPKTFESQPDLVNALGHTLKLTKKIDTRDVLGQTIFLWNCIYENLVKLESEYPDRVKSVRHEDWCEDPIGTTRTMYARLGLSETSTTRHTIHRLAHGRRLWHGNNSLAVVQPRDAIRVATEWESRVTDEDRERIKEHISPVFRRFYSVEN